MIHICGDEFGYWANAAYVKGYDWTSLMSNTAYYAAGYSVILLPLMYLKFSMAVLYKIAIGINICFLVIIYLISFHIVKKLFHDVSEYILSILCGISIVYPSFIVYAQTTMSETTIALVFWAMLLCIFEYEETRSRIACSVFVVSGIYAYLIHQRNLGILIAALVVFLFMILQDRMSRKSMLIIVIAGIALFGVGMIWKQVLMDRLWNTSVILSANNYSGQMEKVRQIVHFDGIVRLFVSLGGKLFYLLSSTVMIAAIGFIYIARQLIDGIRRIHKIRRHTLFYMFIIMAFLLNLAIAAVTAINLGRKDTLYYGRYAEVLAGPLLVLGFISIYKENKLLKQAAVVTIIYIACTFIVVKKIAELDKFPQASINIVGILPHVTGQAAGPVEVQYLCVLSISIFGGIWIARYFIKNKNLSFLAILAICGAVWINHANYSVEHQVKEIHQSYNNNILPIAESLLGDKSLGEKEIIYVIEDMAVSQEDFWNTNIDRLQFLIAQYPIIRREYSEQKMEIQQKNSYYILLKNSKIYNQYVQELGGRLIKETNTFGLYYKEM